MASPRPLGRPPKDPTPTDTIYPDYVPYGADGTRNMYPRPSTVTETQLRDLLRPAGVKLSEGAIIEHAHLINEACDLDAPEIEKFSVKHRERKTQPMEDVQRARQVFYRSIIAPGVVLSYERIIPSQHASLRLQMKPNG